ncbi:HNH endonuclease signature motif containing protein [Phycicoccus sp.]|uniref:HNH endonuclease signature motif containing protein n=1 Tax=Phycicoccus sp. TaxID=1902410 RepID=UPI002C9A22BD|nr:HNH endonuclease signature motif containing protein [Phycicoccus sp.]HMM93794.1 HNH endonuclease signature motif containing protein [Phycicoccus sp.]
MATDIAKRADAADVCAAAVAARSLVAGVLSPAGSSGSVTDWAGALGELQSLADVVAAAQDEAIVRLAAIEPAELESGEVVDTHRALGHVALDAPSVVSGVLTLSAVHAERRVRDAVRRAADGPAGTDTSTGLGGLHAAMAEGRLDAYRAQVVAHELEEVPAELAAGVVESLTPWFAREDATRLRRRVRRVLTAISPDLLRQRAVRARATSGLRRWVDEPGVDTWLGTFPPEEACAAWAAIDALAQRYVEDGICTHVERARGKALTDLVTTNATVELRVQFVAPAGSPGSPPSEVRQAGAPDDLVAVHGLRAGEPALVARGWLAQVEAVDAPAGPVLHPATGALLDAGRHLDTAAYRPGARLAALVRARDGHCRFPGCHVAARFCDLDHVLAWPVGPTSASNLACLCRRHHRVKQRRGWSARLADDGTMTWTDPTGRTRQTAPVDHRALVLPAAADLPPPPPRAPDARHSALEFRLEHAVGGSPPAPRACRLEVRRPPRPVTVTGMHPPRPRPTPRGDPPF